jgi:hypothetical protein
MAQSKTGTLSVAVILSAVVMTVMSQSDTTVTSLGTPPPGLAFNVTAVPPQAANLTFPPLATNITSPPQIANVTSQSPAGTATSPIFVNITTPATTTPRGQQPGGAGTASTISSSVGLLAMALVLLGIN